MEDENTCPNVRSPVPTTRTTKVLTPSNRVAGLARGATTPGTPTSADKRSTDAMFDLVYSPPVAPGRKTVAFKCGAAKGREQAFVAASNVELDVERKKMERFAALADSGKKCRDSCSSPGDAESRETKRYLAALRLQTLLHHRRAERARVKTLRLERAEREKADRDRAERAERRSVVDAASTRREAQRRAEESKAELKAADFERRALEAEAKVAALTREAERRSGEAETKIAALEVAKAKEDAAHAAEVAALRDVAAREARRAEEVALAAASQRQEEDVAEGALLLRAELDRLRGEADAATRRADAVAAKVAGLEAEARALVEEAAGAAVEAQARAEAELARVAAEADAEKRHVTASAESQRAAIKAAAEAEVRRVSERCRDAEAEAARKVAAAEEAAALETERAFAAAKAESAEAVATSIRCQRELATKATAFDADRVAWDQVRRKLHNRVVELQGNIRVFVRVRPALLHVDQAASTTKEAALAVTCPRSAANSSGDAVEVPETMAPGGPPRKPRVFKFAFDRVLPPETSQAAVFEEVRPFAQSALDGYRVCVFAYGQTGSGKTHTVFGTSEEPGLLRRSLELVFAGVENFERTQGWTFELHIEMLEIYTEKVYDLCADDIVVAAHSANKKKNNYTKDQPQPKKLNVRDTGEEIVVEGLTKIRVTSLDHALETLSFAFRRRHVGATKSNAVSSRSHAIFALKIDGAKPNGETRNGVLNLVDLAGSERLSVSGSNNDPQLLREAQAINSSLSSLGNTISALAQGGSNHIPFRDSRLTFLLQPCLGGDSKTLAIFCLAPELRHERETLCTLRFGQKVSKCAPKGVCTKCGTRAVDKS